MALGREVKYILFPDEGHARRRPEAGVEGDGERAPRWVRAENIKIGLEAELNWYVDRIVVSKTGA